MPYSRKAKVHSYLWIWHQPGLQYETLPQKIKKKWSMLLLLTRLPLWHLSVTTEDMTENASDSNANIPENKIYLKLFWCALCDILEFFIGRFPSIPVWVSHLSYRFVKFSLPLCLLHFAHISKLTIHSAFLFTGFQCLPTCRNPKINVRLWPLNIYSKLSFLLFAHWVSHHLNIAPQCTCDQEPVTPYM